jgi:hypothetical protein
MSTDLITGYVQDALHRTFRGGTMARMSLR